jgi:hypothetical protein
MNVIHKNVSRNIYFLRGPVTTAYLHSCMCYTTRSTGVYSHCTVWFSAGIRCFVQNVVPVPTHVLVIPVPSRSPSLLQVPCKIR